MDTITSNPTNPLISTSTPVFSDNVQDLLGTGTLQVHPSAIITVNSIDDAVNSSPGVTTLRDAINKANADSGEDLIVFDRSLFSTAQTINLGRELDITHSLDIIAPRDSLTGGDLVTVSGRNESRVFEIKTGATVNLSGLIVANGSSMNDKGGGILNSGTLNLDSSIVRKNSAKLVGGGGIYNDGTLAVSNSTISDNSATRAFGSIISGGGIDSVGTLTVSNSIISGNSANGNNSFGGGISATTVTVSDSTISDNMAFGGRNGFGGGISGGTVTVNNSTISGNSASSTISDGGGGISATTVTVNNSTISGNSVSNRINSINSINSSGGGIYSDGTLTVSNSTISGNSSSNGGGIASDGTLTVNNSTISGNSATQNGGGIYNYYTGTLTLLFSTVTQNLAANGGGVYQKDVPPTSTSVRGSFNVRNTIIASNLNSTNGANPDVSGTFTSNGYNLIGDNTGSTGFGVTGDIVGTTDNPIDPLLAPLAFNGGSTQTVALLPGSPAIGAADPIVLDTDPITDQRGLPRRAALGSADIGAFEFS